MFFSKSRSTASFYLKPVVLLVFIISCCENPIYSQSLNISTGGQTGISGTNWSTSGSNPVTIAVTGTANINNSVIQGYLNTGISVIVNNTTVGTIINNNISKTAGAAAFLSIRDIGNIKVAANVTISSTSNAMDIILWADADNSQSGLVMDFLYVNAGTSFISNGGKIVMAGGPDNGSNGGVSNDGIPDGFAWNGSNSTDYASNEVGGLTLGPRGGTGTVIALNSSGGEIILRGSSSNNCTFPGITSQGNLRIESGTGKITMFGKSTTGHAVELTYGAVPNIAITSSSSAIPAIDIKGTTTGSGHGFWASNAASGNVLIQSTSALSGGITLEGTSTGATGVNLGTANTGIYTQLLSQTGTINIKGLGSSNNSVLTNGDVYIGNRKDATAVQGITPIVTTSDASILIQANDQVSYSNSAGKATRFGSTGSLSIEAYSAGFSGTIRWAGNPVFASSFSNITLGEVAENYSIGLNNSLTSAGNITAYCSDLTLENGVGLSSTTAGTIAVNAKGSIITNGSTRRTISTINGPINFYADSDASGNGQLDIDYVTFNAGTAETRLRAETLNWTTTSNTDKPYVNGTGAFVIEPADASFQNVSTAWFVFDQDANGIAGLTLGKPTNTGDITHETTAITVAGPIAFYGGLVNLNINLTSSADGDIFIKANTNRNGGASITPAAAIFKTAGSGTLTFQGAGRINSSTITASGTARLNVVLWSDYINANNGGVRVDAITTNGGHLWVGGSNSNGGSYTWNGLTVGNGPSVGSPNNNFNAIDFYGPVSTAGGSVMIWGGNGNGGGTTGIGILGTGTSISSGAGDVVLVGDNVEGNNVNITTTGKLILIPDAGAYPAAITWGGAVSGGNFNATDKYDLLNILNFSMLGGLSIGYYDGLVSSGVPVVLSNSSAITSTAVTSIAGGITLYSPSLTINDNISSTTGGTISLFTNALTIAGGANLTSSGILLVEPIAAATTIGIAGGTGSLAITTTHLNSNFTDGFSEIIIGNTAAGNIAVGSAVTVRDNFRLLTSGQLLLNQTLTLGNNNLRFIGTQISAATGMFVKTNGVGKLFQYVANGSSKVFPVGASLPGPVTVTNTTGISDTFNATVFPNVYYGGGTSGSAVVWSGKVGQTWNIGNTSSGTGLGSVDLAFGWDPDTQVTGSLTTPRLAYSMPSQWLYAPSTPTFNLAAGTLNYSGYTGVLTSFAIVQANISLPVHWVSFTGQRVQNTVVLKWKTGTELDNVYFEVERSVGGRYENIGKVAAVLNGSDLNDYSFIDIQPLQGNTQYRIRQVDRDGRCSYSSVVIIKDLPDNDFRILSNPGIKQLVVNTPSQMAGDVRLVMYDGNGRKLIQQKLQAGRNTITTGTVAKGVYYVTIVKGGNTLFSDQVLVY